MSILPFEVSLYESMIRDLEPLDSWKAMAAELGKLYLAYLEKSNAKMSKNQFDKLLGNLGESAQVANDRNPEAAHG